MHIIIEGIDHCGKDTLINALQQKYGGYVIHSSKPVEIDAYSVENCKDTLSVYNSLYTSNSSMKYNPFGYINVVPFSSVVNCFKLTTLVSLNFGKSDKSNHLL